MLRATLSILALFLLVACKEPATKDVSPPTVTASPDAPTPAPAPAPASASASASASAPASASASASASAPAACVAVPMDKPTTLTGKIANGDGQNGRMETEKFQTLVLDKPACGPDKAPVPELQLYTSDKSIDLKKMVGKSVTIEGSPFEAHTAHHHRPIVMEVKKLTAK